MRVSQHANTWSKTVVTGPAQDRGVLPNRHRVLSAKPVTSVCATERRWYSVRDGVSTRGCGHPSSPVSRWRHDPPRCTRVSTCGSLTASAPVIVLDGGVSAQLRCSYACHECGRADCLRSVTDRSTQGKRLGCSTDQLLRTVQRGVPRRWFRCSAGSAGSAGTPLVNCIAASGSSSSPAPPQVGAS
jgi:hypothetical protein